MLALHLGILVRWPSTSSRKVDAGRSRKVEAGEPDEPKSAEEHSHWTDARLRQHLGWHATNTTLAIGAPDAPRRCANGHLNPFEGRCTCDYGFAGRSCRQDVVPACRTAGGLVESCTARKALPCACVRQCLSAGAFAVHTREPFHAPVCVMGHNASSVGEEGGRSSTRQAQPQPQLFRWRLDSAGGFQREPLPVGGARFAPAIHQRHDEALERDSCYRNCSGSRGHCLRGACVCGAPHYGPGCVFPLEGAAPSPGAPSWDSAVIPPRHALLCTGIPDGC